MADSGAAAETGTVRAEGTVRADGADRLGRGLAAVAWLVIVAVAIVAPLLARERLFPDGSPNRDEAGYLSQANAIGAGEVTLPADTHDPFFRPFLSGLEGDEVVFKYQPAWPALIALSDLATGGTAGALVLTSVAAALAVALLAREVADSWRVAWVAAALFATSPWFVVQSGTYLAYPATVAVLATATALTLRGVRRSSPALLAAAGAAFGLAVFHRPYDAVLGGLPVLAWLVASRGWSRALRRDLLALAAGAAPLVAVIVAYNLIITGSPVQFPFSMVGPLDRFGFGERSSLADPGEPGPFDFTVGQAWRTVTAYTGSLVDWLPGAGLAAAAAVAGLVVRRRDGRAWLVAAQGLVFPLGYFVWWGAANARAYRLHDLLGPIYWFPLLATVAVLGAIGIDRAVAWLVGERSTARPLLRPLGVGAAVAVLGLVSVLTVGDTRAALDEARENQAAEMAPLQPPGDRPSVIVAERRFRGDLYVPTEVPAHLDGPHLVAMDPTWGLDRFALVDRFADRDLYDVLEVHEAGEPFTDGTRVRRQLTVLEGDRVELAVEVTGPGEPFAELDGERTELERVGDRATVVLSAPGGGGDVEVPEGEPQQLTIGIGDHWLRWLVRLDPGTDVVQVLDPPTPYHHWQFPGHDAADVIEDVSARIRPAAP